MNDTIDAPDHIEGGNYDGAVLLGTEDDEAVYWNIGSDELVKQTERGESAYSPEESVPEYLAATERDGYEWQYSELGAFLRAVAPVEAAGETVRVLSPKQTRAYAVRDILGVSRKRAGRLLDVSKHTVDNQLATARTKVELAGCLTNAIERSAGGDE